MIRNRLPNSVRSKPRLPNRVLRFSGFLVATAMCLPVNVGLTQETAVTVDVNALSKLASNRLVELQEEDGAWPYEGVYRVGGEIPVGYRIGGTAIVCEALLYAPTSNQAQVDDAIRRGTELILAELEDSRMELSTVDTYDVRVWGHIFALDYFCRLAESRQHMNLQEKTNAWIPRLTEILVKEQINDGGWNYASQSRHAAFVTATAVQALLWAKQHGGIVPDECLTRAAEVLQLSRVDTGAFQYSGVVSNRGRVDLLPGSIARSAICESTLLLLDQGDLKRLQGSIDAFHEHWDELEKRRKKTGTHKPPYGVAPYYFYFGHRYLAQSIGLLDEPAQAEAFNQFHEVLMRTRDDDNTWNDRVFDRSKAYGTAMSLLALNRASIPLPPRIKSE